MRIEKLDIKSFGKIKDLQLTFSPGMNMVYGGNETGKSTLQAFIKAMLFGLKSGRTSKDGALPPLKRYKPWLEGDYGGSMEYRLDSGKAFRIERNFNTNAVAVYDQFYNDVSGSFDLTREKGLQFAEKHLGMGESCFERTAFIKQMEARVDEDGSKELQNRLLNVKQTGLEEVSLLKAQEALRDALKNHVGTDKTSTRPMDRVISRLEQLVKLEKDYFDRRSSVLRMENELAESRNIKAGLEKKKLLLEKALGIATLKKEMDAAGAGRKELEGIAESIEAREKELDAERNRLEALREDRRHFEKFSPFGNEDIDEISMAYQALSSLIHENKRLAGELERKRLRLEGAAARLGEAAAFGELGENADSYVMDLYKALKGLEEEKAQSSGSSMEERLRRAEAKNRGLLFAAAVSALLALGAAWRGFTGWQPAYIAASIFAVMTALLAYFKAKSGGELHRFKDEKGLAFVFSGELTEEIEKKQKALDTILGKAGAASMEDFFTRKTEYDGHLKELELTKGEIKVLENEISLNSFRLEEHKASIVRKLIAAGIEDTAPEEVCEEHIRDFKYGVRKLAGLEPGINYARQREEDLESRLKDLYGKASSLCRTEKAGGTDLRLSMEDMAQRTEALEKKLGSCLEELQNEGDRELPSGLVVGFAFLPPGEFERQAGDQYNAVCRESGSADLKIAEYEAVLKNFHINDEEIVAIKAEIEELENRKAYLSDMSGSLRLALEVLTEAGLELQRDFAPALNEKLSRIISDITGGRYRDVKADDRLLLKAVSAESAGIVAVPALSSGTVDQIYLSLRLAMVELLAGPGESLPLITDEIFAQYDDGRSRQTFRYFQKLAGSGQVIFFTCKHRELEMAEEIFGGGLNTIKLL